MCLLFTFCVVLVLSVLVVVVLVVVVVVVVVAVVVRHSAFTKNPVKQECLRCLVCFLGLG